MKTDDIKAMAHDILEKRAIESDQIEYKKSADITLHASILKTACAYSNNFMGREIGLIFIGVEEVDDNETGEKAIPMRPITGITESRIEKTENTLKSLLSNIHPKPNYHLLTDTIDNRYYIIIAVEPGTNGPYSTSEKAEQEKKLRLKAGRYIRVRRDTRLPNTREEFELLKKYSGFHFSSELNETATIDDLSYEYMKEYLIATKAKPDTLKLSKLDMAKSLNLISETEYGGYRARNFAVLMFSDRPQDFIPYARVEVIREVVGTDKMSSQIFDGPIWIQAQRVIEYFEEKIMSAYTVRESDLTGHRMVLNYPKNMFSELATNCILHKEYDKKQYIGIYVYSDHISFINHNRPMPPVTIEDMNTQTEFRSRNYLNPEIKEMFFSLNLIESYGSGIRRAKNAMAENNSPELVFEPLNDADDYTMVTAYINKEYQKIQQEELIAKAGDSVDSSELKADKGPEKADKKPIKADKKPIKIGSKESLIIEYLNENGSISNREARAILDLADSTVKRLLKKMVDFDILYVEGERKGTRYYLKNTHPD